MDKKELKKLVKSETKDIRDQYGFFIQTDGVFLKLTGQNVLQNICFEFMPLDFICNVAIQPLYVYEYVHVFSLSMGSRLNKVKVLFVDDWSYERGEESLQEIKYYLLKNGMPWLEKYGSPEGIVNFILTDLKREYYKFGFHMFDSFQQKQYLGFSLLYLGRIKEGLFWLEELTKEITIESVDYLHKYKRDLLQIITTIRNNPEKTGDMLEGFIQENKKALKLKDTQTKINYVMSKE
jgi:hypothetical protein